MRIDIWSDVVCPWCFIGKRRLETALAGFEHADDVEVVYHSFELDPAAPRGGTEPMASALERKYGPGVDQMTRRATEVAAGEGLAFRLDDTVHASTADAHRLLHLALAEVGPGAQRGLKEALMAAYFLHGRNVSDAEVLRDVALESGLPADRVDEVLRGQEYAANVAADVARARALGASGVPFFVVDDRFGISGAQEVGVFADTLDRAWAQAHPEVTLVGAADTAAAEVCGPDGCEVPSGT